MQWPSLSDHFAMDDPSQANPACCPETHISDLPSVILSNIVSKISSPRVRNCISLTCRDWYFMERQTRTELSLRGNIWVMHELPACFQQVTVLDLSQCSPWGSSLFQSTPNGEEIGNCLRTGFPNVIDLTVYVRDAMDIQMVVWIWPDLEYVRLVRWHQRPMENTEGSDLGNEIEGLLSASKKLKTLNLSKFYCWTEDIPPALQSGAPAAANLQGLNLLKLAPNGFKALEVGAITSSCPNLVELYMVCEFDHRLIDSVGDEALLSIGTNCPRLKVLHLVDYNELGAPSDDLNGDGFATEDSRLSRQGLEAMFKALPHLEDLVFYLSQNMRDVGAPFEVFASSCPKLRSLKLSHFHGVCGGPHPDGIARCAGLLDLRLNNCGDITDDGLKALSVGCPKLIKLGLRHCKLITKEGLHTCVSNLSRSLKDVEISFCKLLPTAVTLKALEPIQTTVKYLYLDCVWDEHILVQEAAQAAAASQMQTTTECGDQNQSSFGPPVDIGTRMRTFRSSTFFDADGMDEMIGSRTDSFLTPHRLITAKRRRANTPDNGNATTNALIRRGEPQSSLSWMPRLSASGNANLGYAVGGRSHQPVSGNRVNRPMGKVWKSLETLSLWIPLGEVITPLAAMGLEVCPVLHELKVKVEGDGLLLRRPKVLAWGIESLDRYPKLEKLELDLSEVTGFSFSAPTNYTDLSLWERHYLVGIDNLHLTELDYWPPSDKEVNRRGLSLPAAGLLSQCSKVRKLFVHGTAHEHFLTMLNRCPCLRDVQLRGDYYPAPETISCQRFEAAVAKRGFPD